MPLALWPPSLGSRAVGALAAELDDVELSVLVCALAVPPLRNAAPMAPPVMVDAASRAPTAAFFMEFIGGLSLVVTRLFGSDHNVPREDGSALRST
jgi:hypothetical protein